MARPTTRQGFHAEERPRHPRPTPASPCGTTPASEQWATLRQLCTSGTGVGPDDPWWVAGPDTSPLGGLALSHTAGIGRYVRRDRALRRPVACSSEPARAEPTHAYLRCGRTPPRGVEHLVSPFGPLRPERGPEPRKLRVSAGQTAGQVRTPTSDLGGSAGGRRFTPTAQRTPHGKSSRRRRRS
jgi:hypothetical protein